MYLFREGMNWVDHQQKPHMKLEFNSSKRLFLKTMLFNNNKNYTCCLRNY